MQKNIFSPAKTTIDLQGFLVKPIDLNVFSGLIHFAGIVGERKNKLEGYLGGAKGSNPLVAL